MILVIFWPKWPVFGFKIANFWTKISDFCSKIWKLQISSNIIVKNQVFNGFWWLKIIFTILWAKNRLFRQVGPFESKGHFFCHLTWASGQYSGHLGILPGIWAFYLTYRYFAGHLGILLGSNGRKMTFGFKRSHLTKKSIFCS